jgi:hypothetical protein
MKRIIENEGGEEEEVGRSKCRVLSKHDLGLLDVAGISESSSKVNMKLNDITVKPEGWKSHYFAPYDSSDPDTYPLRQDGTSKDPAEDGKYYGEKWQEEFFDRIDAKESDPDYIFFTKVAGMANTTIERLLDFGDIETRQLRARYISQRQTAALRQQFEQYKAALKNVEDISKEIEEKRKLIPKLSQMEGVINFSRSMIKDIESGAKRLTERIIRANFFGLYERILSPLMIDENLKSPIKWSEMAGYGSLYSTESQEKYLEDVDNLMSLIIDPFTSTNYFVNNNETPSGPMIDTNEVIEGYRSRLSGTMDEYVSASEYTEANFSVILGEGITDKSIEESPFMNIRKNAKLIMDKDPTEAGVTSSKIMFLVLYYGVERGGEGFLKEVDRVVWDFYESLISDKLSLGDSITNFIARAYSEASRGTLLEQIFATEEGTSSLMDATQQRSENNQNARSLADDLRGYGIRAWNFLSTRGDIYEFIEMAERTRGSPGRIAPLSELETIRNASEPTDALSAVTGNTLTVLKVYRDQSITGGAAGVEAEIADLEKKKVNAEIRVDNLKDMSDPGQEVDIPYRHEASWVLRPEFTGRIQLQPIIFSAINEAHSIVKKYVPSLSGGDNNESLKKLMRDEKYSTRFAQLTAMCMAQYRTNFQVRNVNTSRGSILTQMKSIVQGLRESAEGGSGFDPLNFRSPRPSEIYSLARRFPRGRVYDPSIGK